MGLFSQLDGSVYIDGSGRECYFCKSIGIRLNTVLYTCFITKECYNDNSDINDSESWVLKYDYILHFVCNNCLKNKSHTIGNIVYDSKYIVDISTDKVIEIE